MASSIKAFEKGVLDLSFEAASDLSAKQYYIVNINGSDKIAVASTAGQRALGILQDDPVSGQTGRVRVMGVSKVKAGGTFSQGDLVTTTAAGKAVKADDNDEVVLGRALMDAIDGDVVSILLGADAAGGQVNHGTIWSIPVTLANITGAGDVVTTYTPGFAGTIEKFSACVTTAVTTGSKAATLNLEIGTTNVTGGSLALTSANCTPLGAVVDATAITAANQFIATDSISVEAATVTAFAEGAVVLFVVLK
jgi:hypothetical protein